MRGTKSNTGRARTRPLTQREKLFVAAISRGETITESARCAGHPEQVDRVQVAGEPAHRGRVEQHAADRSDAVQAIRELVRAKGIPPLVKLKAATQLAEMTSGSTKNRAGLEDRDATIAGTILP